MPVESPILIAFLFFSLVVLLIGIFQWLWNTTMPQVFKLGQITFWQALRLLIIAGFLFGTSKLPSFNYQF